MARDVLVGGNGFDYCNIYVRKYDLSTNTLYTTQTVANFTPNIQNFAANPVLDGDTNYEEKMVAWREPDGIKVRFYDNHDGWYNIDKITGTGSDCYYPSIVNYNGYTYAVCWEVYGSNAVIRYTMASGGQTYSYSTVEQVSPSGWNQNVRPQITLVHGNKPTVAWVSYNNVSEGVSVHERQRGGIGSSYSWGSVTSFSMNDANTVSAVIGTTLGTNIMNLLWNDNGTVYKASYNGSSWSSASAIANGSSGSNYVSVNNIGDTGLMALWTKPGKSLNFYLSSGTALSIASTGSGTSTGKILTKTVSSTSSQSSADSSLLSSRHTKHAIIELSRIMDNKTLLSTKPEQVKDKEVEGYIAAEISWVKMDNNGKTRNIDFTNSEKEISTVPFTVSSGKTTLDLGSAVYGSGIDVSSARLKKLSAFVARITVNDSKTGKVLKSIWAPSSDIFDGIRDKSFGEFKKVTVDVSEFAGREVTVNLVLPVLDKLNINPLIVDDYIIDSKGNNGMEKGAGESLADKNEIPQEYSLHQNYPNPFNPTTTISYDLPKASNVILKIYNSIGQEMLTLANGNEEAGYHAVTLNMNNFSSGIYFYRMTAGNFSSVKKLILMK